MKSLVHTESLSCDIDIGKGAIAGDSFGVRGDPESAQEADGICFQIRLERRRHRDGALGAAGEWPLQARNRLKWSAQSFPIPDMGWFANSAGQNALKTVGFLYVFS